MTRPQKLDKKDPSFSTAKIVKGYIEGTVTETGKPFSIEPPIFASLQTEESEFRGFITAFDSIEEQFVITFPPGYPDREEPYTVNYPKDVLPYEGFNWVYYVEGGQGAVAHTGQLRIKVSDSRSRISGDFVFNSESGEIIATGRFDLSGL